MAQASASLGDVLSGARNSMPCAAASSSIATMADVLPAIGVSRRAANVAMLTWSSWFAEVGSESTDAGCASDLFSDASAAAVTCAIMKPGIHAAILDQERRQLREIGIHQQRDAALRQCPRLREHQRQVVGRERDGFGVEIAARQDLAGVGEHQRIVGDGIRFGEQDAGHVPPLVEAGPHDLRLASQAVRILHAAAVKVRRADRASGEQVPVDSRGVDLSTMPAHRMNARVERRVAAQACVDRHRARDERGGHGTLCGEQPGERQRGRHLRAVEQRQPFLGR